MGTIRLAKVKIYQNKNLVLSDVNLEMKQGEFTYIIGRTGSGKSSLLKILYGDLPLTNGEGEVAGFDLRKLRKSDIPKLRRKIGIVFQDFQLLSDRSARENLTFVLRCTGWDDTAKIDLRVNEMLERVGLGTKGFKKPHELSGGEQQRLVIARALLNEPELIIADEPTGNLDPETSVEIMGLLFEISKSGRSVLMATHNYFLIERFPSRVLRCEGGKVEEF
ncbi:MAG: ATP-binding cassette domain-containing protein [Bacteroidetes bacterium]|nr:ATP-binding cassette domain-containing protein [Bacteroidota bacterium]